jgi:hypothetical protein
MLACLGGEGSSRDLGSQSLTLPASPIRRAKYFTSPRCFSFRMIHGGPPAGHETPARVTEPGRIQRAWVTPMRSGWCIANVPACRLSDV